MDVACAMRITHRPTVDENQAPIAGDSCPVSFRLARYREWPGQCDP